MAYFIVSQPRRSYYEPPQRWAWGREYDPFDLFSEFIGHHPTSLLGFPSVVPGLTHQTPSTRRKEEDCRWHKVVKLPPFFGPDDFTVKTDGRTLNIHAVHEVKDEEGGVDRCEVSRKVEVPEQVDIETVKTLWLKRGGILVVGQVKKSESEKSEPKASLLTFICGLAL